MSTHDRIREQVGQYYSARLLEHGAAPAGVDWNGAASQKLRFRQLARLWEDRTEPFTVLDYGCGYGAMVSWLEGGCRPKAYVGVDLSEAMLEAGRQTYGEYDWVRFCEDGEHLEPQDFVVASGIFNVKQDEDIASWEAYIQETMDRLRALCRLGFAFNMLTSWSDPPKMRPDLYYGDPCRHFATCKQSYSRNVALLHDYGLYEFTILVRLSDNA